MALKARCAAKRRPVCHNLHDDAKLVDPRPDPLAELTARELLAVLEAEIQNLPAVCRLPVALCCLDGLTLKEAASRLGLTEGAVKGHLERGRARLHARLLRRGFKLAAGLGVVEAARGCLAAAPPKLLVSQTVKAGLGFAGHAASPLAGASAEVVKLAQGVLKGTAMLRLKLVLGLTVLVGMTTLGARGLTPSAGVSNGQTDAAKGVVVEPQQLKDKDWKPRLDQFGDPLPAGVVARLGTVRFRHEGEGRHLVFSPNGKILVGATRSGVSAWDVSSGLELYRLPWGVPAISADGTTLGIWDTQELRLCQLNSGKQNHKIQLPKWDIKDGPPSPVHCLCFAPDNKTCCRRAENLPLSLRWLPARLWQR